MQFPTPLLRGTLVKRYKRFLADVTLENGDEITAHVANSGSMLGLKEPGMEVWLSLSDNPKRKLKYSWELVRHGDGLVGINTMHPNKLVAEAIEDGTITELSGYDGLRREVKYGKNSRIDILLTSESRPDCYVEIKSVTLRRDSEAEFPDAVTARGAKHLVEMTDMVAGGARAVMVYLVQREDCAAFSIADDIDPTYAANLTKALSKGVEAICYVCRLTPEKITVEHTIPIEH
ncbi:MAG: DNA/RNA nuclease SfsA [Rhodospirillaceae bacterium]|jgi:sugar fermentation stimulation protein A|nr:DNA/RNA nuclease SfsA [Rhodospirillaceae bacterium]MBT5455635.1 DNA/RNA nuclease SfsA [Rhodospirillaceae bacterium]